MMQADSMRPVLLIAGGLNVARGGQERSVGEFRALLAARGVRVEIAAPGTGERPLRVAGALRSARARSLLGEAERAARSARSEGFIVHSMLPAPGAHLYMPRTGILPTVRRQSGRSRPSRLGRLAAGIGARFDLARNRLDDAERRMLADPCGTIVVAISDLIAEDARSLYGVPDGRIRVVRNGVDLARLEAPDRREAERLRLGAADGETLLLAVAGNHRFKGVDRLVRALRGRLEPIGARLAIAGGRARPSPCPRIRYLGHCENVLPCFQACDVLVHPTYYDPSSRVVLEAIALGKPVITTRWNGAADFLRDGGGIVLDSPEDLDALRRAVGALCDPDRRAACARGLEGKRREVSMGRHLEEMLAVYRELSR